jgi:hypothetical protein
MMPVPYSITLRRRNDEIHPDHCWNLLRCGALHMKWLMLKSKSINWAITLKNDPKLIGIIGFGMEHFSCWNWLYAIACLCLNGGHFRSHKWWTMVSTKCLHSVETVLPNNLGSAKVLQTTVYEESSLKRMNFMKDFFGQYNLQIKTNIILYSFTIFYRKNYKCLRYYFIFAFEMTKSIHCLAILPYEKICFLLVLLFLNHKVRRM